VFLLQRTTGALGCDVHKATASSETLSPWRTTSCR